MALQINIEGLRTAIGRVLLPNPIIARFKPDPTWDSLNLKYEFKYAILDNEQNYGRLDKVLFEKPVQIPIYETLTEEQIEQEVEPEIIDYQDGIQKIILPSILIKSINSIEEITALYAQIEQIMPTQSVFVKNVFGYHMMAKELLSPILGEDNIVIRMDLA